MSQRLCFEHVGRRFGHLDALEDFSLCCAPRIPTCLVGPNGSGKSTALALAAGLLAPTLGTIELDGKKIPPWTLPESVGYLPQTSAFHPLLSVGEVVDFAAAVRQVGQDDRRRALEVTGLVDVLGRGGGELWGGWVRRLGLFTALVGSPRLLLLDEPLVGLDPETHDRVMVYLGECIESGATVVMASHEFEVLDRLIPQLAVLDEGRLRAVFAAGSGPSRANYRQALSQAESSESRGA